jgi:predicted Fe-S protein YdhL (DUF1289 family)
MRDHKKRLARQRARWAAMSDDQRKVVAAKRRERYLKNREHYLQYAKDYKAWEKSQIVSTKSAKSSENLCEPMTQ